MKIGLDFDGVICNDELLKQRAAQKLFGVDLPQGRAKRVFIEEDGILSMEQYLDLQRYVWSPEGIDLMEPIEGVFDYIVKMISEGHSVKVITSRTNGALALAEKWVRDHGVDVPFFSSGYVPGVGPKNKAEKAVGLDVYVDDRPSILEQLSSIVPKRILFSWKYNEDETPNGVTRVSSWRDLYAHIESLGTRQSSSSFFSLPHDIFSRSVKWFRSK